VSFSLVDAFEVFLVHSLIYAFFASFSPSPALETFLGILAPGPSIAL